MRRLTTLLLFLAIVPPAAAEPGEPPIELLAPVGGATVAPDIDGIPARFTCPPTAAEPPFGSATAYGVDLSRSPALDASGRLADRIGTGLVEVGDAGGECRTRLGGGSAPRPQVTPGTYHWQAWRYCDSCPDSSYETSTVASFRIGLGGRVVLRAPKRAFAGYAVAFELGGEVGAVYDTDGVQIRRGGRWTNLTTRTGDALVARLPKGRQKLRGFVRSGDQQLVSAVRTVRVVKARDWVTGRRDDGAYRDSRRGSVAITVSKRGRRIARLRADVPVDCVDLNAPGGTTPSVRTVELASVRVAPDGRIALVGRFRGATVTFLARLQARRLRASTLRYSDGGCAGRIEIDARRR